MRIRQSWVIGAVLLVSGAAYARGTYGPAGCGLGAVVLGDDAGFVQIIAATLNAISFNQSFGISTGTLECGEATVKGIKRNAQIYIEGNREVVARDIARGQGDTIVGLSAIAGCRDTQKVGVVLQQNYESIFPTDRVPSEQVTDSIIKTLQAEPSLQCQQLS